MKKSLFATAIAFLLFLSPLLAQENETPINLGKKISIRSAILGEIREIMIAAPANAYQKVPMILVFDGESLFIPVASAVRFMTYSPEVPIMPDAIVVGIPNTNRERDMPIPHEFGKGKGEVNFKKFITDELIPKIKEDHKWNGHVILIGHSQGGYLVSWLPTEDPKLFSWVIALDAPMTVAPQTEVLKTSVSKLMGQQNSFLRYVSVEGPLGWHEEWTKFLPASDNLKQIRFTGESHEAMPFKGIYDGLKYLYRDFQPVRKDLKLAELKEFYKKLSETYGYNYEIPLNVLLSSASRKRRENRKKEILELLDHAETNYGTSNRITRLRDQAAQITKEPDPRIDHYLNLTRPTAEQAQKYAGRWTGELVVPRGQNIPIDQEIVIENGQVKFLAVIPWDKTKREEPEIFHIDKEGRLITGRRNRGSGLIITTAWITDKGTLAGKEEWVGGMIPEDAPAEAKEMMEFVLKNPNTFNLVKSK